jgi:hypothetical protein
MDVSQSTPSVILNKMVKRDLLKRKRGVRMKKLARFAPLLVLVGLVLASCTVSGPPQISVDVTSSGTYSSVNYSVTFNCYNAGGTSVAITYGTMSILGSDGQPLVKGFTQDSSSLTYNQYFGPGQTYIFTMAGHGNSGYLPYYYDYSLTFVDTNGDTSHNTGNNLVLH